MARGQVRVKVLESFSGRTGGFARNGKYRVSRATARKWVKRGWAEYWPRPEDVAGALADAGVTAIITKSPRSPFAKALRARGVTVDAPSSK